MGGLCFKIAKVGSWTSSLETRSSKSTFEHRARLLALIATSRDGFAVGAEHARRPGEEKRAGVGVMRYRCTGKVVCGTVCREEIRLVELAC